MDPLPSITHAFSQLSLVSSFDQELQQFTAAHEIPVPTRTEDTIGWRHFCEEFQKKDLSKETPSQDIRTLYSHIRSIQIKGAFFKQEQNRQIDALQPARTSFVADAVQELRSFLPEERYTQEFYKETFSCFFHGPQPFSTYSEQFRLGTGPQELSGKIDALFQERQAHFLHEMEEWKQQLPRKTLEIKRQFLQDVQTLGFKLPATPPNSPIEETFSTREEIWLTLASKNHLGRITDRYVRSERLEPLAEEYMRFLETFRREIEHVVEQNMCIRKRTKRGLELLTPCQLSGQEGAGSSAKVSTILLLKPMLDITTRTISWQFKAKALKIPKHQNNTASLMSECEFSRILSDPLKHNIVPIQLVQLERYSSSRPLIMAGMMDRYPENNLVKYIKNNSPLSWETKIRFALEIAQAIQTVHAIGMGCCDLKAQNILIKIDAQGRPHAYLSDLSNLGKVGTQGGFRNTYVSYEEFQESFMKRSLTIHQETDLFSFGNTLMILFFNKDILDDLGLSYDKMRTTQQIVEESTNPPPTPEAIKTANFQYNKLGIIVHTYVNNMPSPELKEHIQRLFSLSTNPRPTAQVMVGVFTRALAMRLEY